ncbi:uncharacterized protein LOC122973008 [Thunnus albacares]|uniref:uncharacterized protein LOC122973008 n=1 Tax=Thunnus albacares TaxID=8236 RepID=UPI001CF6BA66|nr:uncharacterized protein LOC122973008 [Thunnus albacares]
MRSAAAFLALLLCVYWTRAQGESGGVRENDITQTEVQSEILGVKATSDQTNITPDIWAELKELRDMVIQHSLELREMEQENTDLKSRLNTAEKMVEELKRENTVLEARMSSNEFQVEELKRENAVLEARLNTAENVVEELKRENTVLEARMSSNELQVEELKRENAAIQARLTASENKNAVLEARMSSNENEVEELKGENAERPKVAFSVGLTDAGEVGPFNTEITLKFSKIFTNIGQAYSPTTGVFIAPVRGAYYFRFNGFETRDTNSVGIRLYHNGEQMTYSFDKVVNNGYVNVSNGFVLQLEKGDMIYLVLCAGCSVHDSTYNRTTFSGFLLFAM